MAKVATRQAFGEALAEVGAQNENVVVLDADLSKSTMTMFFAEKYPNRFFQCGIAEANMIGMATGMSLCGKIPFACSFACFISGRFDTIRMSVGYTRANVKLIGTHAGIGIGEDGHSQMGLEDLALMRSIPYMTVLQPADEKETKEAVRFAAQHDGAVYIRLTRQKCEDVHGDDYRFEMGKGVEIASGADMTIFATGGTVQHAVKAKSMLAEKGIDARIVDIHTIKPIDRELIARCAQETRCMMTVEDHTIMGGMGSAVAEVLAEENCDVPFVRSGVRDVFGESGSERDLYQAHRLDAEGITTDAAAFYQEVASGKMSAV